MLSANTDLNYSVSTLMKSINSLYGLENSLLVLAAAVAAFAIVLTAIRVAVFGGDEARYMAIGRIIRILLIVAFLCFAGSLFTYAFMELGGERQALMGLKRVI